MTDLRMTHLALYVCVTDTRRTKQYPFREGVKIPREIRCDRTGDTFALTLVQYQYDRPAVSEADRMAMMAETLRKVMPDVFGEEAA